MTKSIHDFSPGDTVRANGDFLRDNHPLDLDTDYTVEAVHVRSDNISGTISLVGVVNPEQVDDLPAGSEGSFGWLMFDIVKKADDQERPADDQDQPTEPLPFKVGDRVTLRRSFAHARTAARARVVAATPTTVDLVDDGTNFPNFRFDGVVVPGVPVDLVYETIAAAPDQGYLTPEPVDTEPAPPMQNPAFKPGDIVRCISEDASRNVTPGEVYTVTSARPTAMDERGGLLTLDGVGAGGIFGYRFELVEGATTDSSVEKLPAARDEIAFLKDEIARLTDALDERDKTVQALREDLALATRGRGQAEAILDFIGLNFLTESDLDKVEGFRLGFEAARRED